MKKEIRTVDEKKGIVQITTWDERWYAKPSKNKETGLPEYEFVPSVTWICSSYPKGKFFWKWLADKGWDEAEAIKIAAGNKGSKVHQAIKKYLQGEEVKMNDKFINSETEQEEELTVEEWDCIVSFEEFDKKFQPKVIALEQTFFNEKHGYAGTIDLICEIEGIIHIIDFKTGQNLWPEHELQISAYSHLDIGLKELGIKEQDWEARQLNLLQIGYSRNKNRYKITEVEDKFDLFLNTKQIWANECANLNPSQKDYPLAIQRKKVAPKLKTEQNENNTRRITKKSR